MSTLKKGMQREPAFPDGSPERRGHHGSVPDSHPGVLLPSEIRADRHGSRRRATTLSQDRKHERLNHLVSWALGKNQSAGTHLQQAHGQRGQQTRASASGRQPFAIAVPLIHTVKGSLLARGAFRGGKSVICPKESWRWAERPG